ncbi:lytic transglycosylase domain-containing protein [bacterium]|nr:lytic transglycosylase domain-containing protein [bacterium]
MRIPPLALLPLALAALAAAGGEARAAQRVTFRDFRTLVVEEVAFAGESAELTLRGGGRAEVARASVLAVDEYVPPPEPADGPPAAAEPVGPPAPTWRDRAGAHAAAIEKASRACRVDPAVLTAMALVESRFDRFAVSRKGARGVMQLMPATARTLAVRDVWDAEENISAGARFLRRLLDASGERLDLALAAYNAGEDAVRRAGGIPDYPETRAYVAQVRRLAAALGAGLPRGAALL